MNTDQNNLSKDEVFSPSCDGDGAGAESCQKTDSGSAKITSPAPLDSSLVLPVDAGERAGAVKSKSIDCTSDAAPAQQQAEPAPADGISDGKLEISQGEALTLSERFELESCETIIAKNMESAMWFAQALGTIREKKLYRAGYSTFEQYCRERWEMPARSARRLIDQADVFKRLSEGQNGSAWTVPARPSVVRPLITLPPEHQRAAWSEAVETSGNGHPTVRHVEKVVREYQVKLGLRQAEPVENTQIPKHPNTQPGEPGPEISNLESQISKPNASVVTVAPTDVESAMERFINDGHRLMDLMGTPDSAANAVATEVQRTIVLLEEYKARRARMEFARATRKAA